MVARKPVFRLTPPRVPEAALHQQIARALSSEIAAPGKISMHGVVWWSIDIANYGGKTPGLRITRGIIPGVPDMQIVYRGQSYFVELKAPDGQLSGAQREFAHAIVLAGCPFGAARSVEEVLELLDCWEIPRQRRLRIADKRV